MSGASMEPTHQLLGDTRQLIEGARRQANVALNACQTALCWHIGRRIYPVADSLAALPSKELLQAKLHEAIAQSRAWLAHRSGDEA